MKKITLRKIITLENAEHPQKEKYPDNTIVSKGYMWEQTEPKIGEPFFVLQSKFSPIFHTSVVKTIQQTNNGYILTTINSMYEIKIVDKF